ncbi:MAG: dephospho-CoA kinase [Bacteroidia bacterium]|nr:dephospho-CoA kinase [Bacteroidia bacterium]
MKIIGLTGGMGSGKTTVARMFEALGVAVYIADTEAKLLTNRSKYIRKKLIALLGPKAYVNNSINRPYVAARIFSDKELLQKVNAIIHPRVAQHFKRWVRKQKGIYCIKEAAILFENGGYKQCDATILVTAPKEVRIRRILKRDHLDAKDVLERMSNQWEDERKIPLANFLIHNIDLETTKARVAELHLQLLKPK